MRLVFDTNVLIAAFISRGQCCDLFEHCVREHELVTSGFILDEFRDKLLGKFNMALNDVSAAVTLLQSSMKVIAPSPLEKRMCRDADDDWVLATAVTGMCRCIVTGDKDLLELNPYQNIMIVKPGAFWGFEAASLG